MTSSKPRKNPVSPLLSERILERSTWWSGYCDLNNEEFHFNQSKDDYFVKLVAKNNETMATATKFMKFSWLIALFSL